MPEAMDFDRAHLWHPYSSMTRPNAVLRVERTQGVYLTLDDGRQLIDGISSWWCAAYGHQHPHILAAMQAQMNKMTHVMFGGLTHDKAIELGQKLLKHLPKPLDVIFYADSGSVAIEVAMKMAIQYQVAKGLPQKTNFATIRAGYHGDTWNAMSVSDPTGMHTIFGASLPVRYHLPQPAQPFSETGEVTSEVMKPLRDLLESQGASIAALILEPVMQGAGGMYFYHPDYLNKAKALCQAHGVLLILDEIATGFGRLGRPFAMDYARVVPDIVTLGKALTGGTMTLSATVVTQDVARVISDGPGRAFMHGPTFMANPLACASACAAIELFETMGVAERVKAIEAQMKGALLPLKALPGVADVRVLGAVGVIEMQNAIDTQTWMAPVLERGVWLRPFGRLAYTMPPFIIEPAQLDQILEAMVKATHRASEQFETTAGKESACASYV